MRFSWDFFAKYVRKRYPEQFYPLAARFCALGRKRSGGVTIPPPLRKTRLNITVVKCNTQGTYTIIFLVNCRLKVSPRDRSKFHCWSDWAGPGGGSGGGNGRGI